MDANTSPVLPRIISWALPVLILLALGASLLAQAPPVAAAPAPARIDSGATAWMLTSTALVLLMTPGLALFYGGMVRSKNMLGTMAHSVFAMGIVTLQWILFGYSLAFGDNTAGGLFGTPGQYLFLNNVAHNAPKPF